MLDRYLNHNLFKAGLKQFYSTDPHLAALSQLKYQHKADWWKPLDKMTPGIYILTGGRQIGKSTSCKLLIKHCLQKRLLLPQRILYLPCDEIFDAKELGEVLRFFLKEITNEPFLLIIDEITFVKDWDRVIKALADEGFFKQGVCLLTGSDTLILKDAAMRFPGRRGAAEQTDFHLYPLSFAEYVKLRSPKKIPENQGLYVLFQDYLICGGYLRAINELAQTGKVGNATFATYEQWIRGDVLKRGKNENTLMGILHALLTVGVSQISYSGLTQKVGLVSKETLIDYCRLLERMGLLINLQAFDQNKKQGFPRKDRKFHFTDPFIHRTLSNWLQREGYLNSKPSEHTIVEASVASHCHRLAKTYYFKGQGEVDIIWLPNDIVQAVEIKWSQEIRPSDLKTLKHFKNRLILSKSPQGGIINETKTLPVYQWLCDQEPG
nr:hypothetical protein [Chlamydiota bacterium]